MEQYVGLDVSLKETSVCVVDQTGKIVLDYQQTSANLRRRYGIGGVRSATHANRGIMSANR